jgi:pSer/pThr/pTyr-binding forkhead associated (FHA) protein
VTSDRGDEIDGLLWASGDMMFRVAGLGAERDRLVKVRRPFALLGRVNDADIAFDDRAVSARHAYLHLDARGVFVVDLVTRTGLRVNGSPQMIGWLRPGDSIEVAGRRIELVRIRLDGAPVDPPPCEADLLADLGHDRGNGHGRAPLYGVTLEPVDSGDAPWVLGSELVFLGWSASCGIQVKDSAAARTHCALVRSPRGAYVVDLRGRQTWVEDRLVTSAAVLHDGDLLTIGSTQFTVRVEAPAATALELVPRNAAGAMLARVEGPAEEGRALVPSLSIDPTLIPAEAQNALVAWVVGTIQGGQGEVLRRQGEFQTAIAQVLHQIQQDNAALLNAHLQRIEKIDRELALLRAEIERRGSDRPPLPAVPPLRITHPAAPRAKNTAAGTVASTTWLLQRVNQLEDENRSAWRDLLGRLAPSRRPV